jgi:hypothetical protein
MNSAKTAVATSAKSPLPPKRSADQETKKKYCGQCPVCKSLRSMSATASANLVAQSLLQTGPSFHAHHDCAHGFLEQGRGHAFAVSVFSELSMIKHKGVK